MSPAETLRAAATKLRETASKATPGPWKVGRIAGIGQCVSAPDLKFCVAVESGWVSKDDAAWIALMSPAVAEPLAAHLDHLADMALLTGAPVMREALAFARSILGRQS